MKSVIVLCLAFIAMLALVQSVPVESFAEDGELFGEEVAIIDLDQVEENTGVRQKRVTCDLLSVSTPWGSLNHAGCAAHCLAMRRGYRGGRCSRGVCRCRK
ncbi:defensin-like [Ctenocephalides felis]|uniref:defensin-like n=1 Tax=Ctenocephalides felis TaxID=7515 RepID=UPI000E6E4096|nr:defensin-like [Ctenocephalides felis]